MAEPKELAILQGAERIIGFLVEVQRTESQRLTIIHTHDDGQRRANEPPLIIDVKRALIRHASVALWRSLREAEDRARQRIEIESNRLLAEFWRRAEVQIDNAGGVVTVPKQ